ncbi:MAG: hypothetical protein AAAFM81_12475 [Pseudomonadota bacterium]
MEDLYKSFRSHLYERSSSPLAGAFVLAWLILNYRVLFILFSGEPYAVNFAAIDSMIRLDWFDCLHGACLDSHLGLILGRLVFWFVCPMALAATYIFFYPRLAEPVYRYALDRRQALRRIRQEAEQARLLTLEESNKIFREMRRVTISHEDEVAKLQAEKQALIEELDSALQREPSAQTDDTNQKTESKLTPAESTDAYPDNDSNSIRILEAIPNIDSVMDVVTDELESLGIGAKVRSAGGGTSLHISLHSPANKQAVLDALNRVIAELGLERVNVTVSVSPFRNDR